jgi:hypothetical protein
LRTLLQDDDEAVLAGDVDLAVAGDGRAVVVTDVLNAFQLPVVSPVPALNELKGRLS